MIITIIPIIIITSIIIKYQRNTNYTIMITIPTKFQEDKHEACAFAEATFFIFFRVKKWYQCKQRSPWLWFPASRDSAAVLPATHSTTKQIQNKTRISALVQLLQKVKRTTFENVWQIALRFCSSVVL